MGKEEILARLRRAKAIINNISVAGQQNWRALLVATGDLDEVERAVAAEIEAAKEKKEQEEETEPEKES